MGTIMLIVVLAAWAAVLLPPLLRSRVDNRPNSSVSDFRQQLFSLQRAVPGRAGAMRTMGRSLAPSGLGRPAAPGRPGGRSATISPRGQHSYGPNQPNERAAAPEPPRPRAAQPSRRHGEPERRPSQAAVADAKRRRTNVLFVLLLTTFCSGFLAATSDSPAMVYLFALGLIALGGYIYLLIAMHQREQGRTVGSVLRQHAQHRAEMVRERSIDRQTQVRVHGPAFDGPAYDDEPAYEADEPRPLRRRRAAAPDPLLRERRERYDHYDDAAGSGYDYDDGAYLPADGADLATDYGLDETADIYASYELPRVRREQPARRPIGEPELPGSGRSGRISYGRPAARRQPKAASPTPRDPRDPFGREQAGRDITRGVPARNGRHATGQHPVTRKRQAPLGDPLLR